MTAIRYLYLDLEGTVIMPVHEGWLNTGLINTGTVRAYLKNHPQDYLQLFSFALHDERDVRGFEDHIKGRLELSLGMPVSYQPTVFADIIPACCRAKRISSDGVGFRELRTYWGKQEAFRLFVQDRFGRGMRGPERPSVEVTLLDDDVTSEEFFWPDLNLRGKILNINDL